MSDTTQASSHAPSSRNSLFYSYIFGGLAVLTLLLGFVIYQFTTPSVPDEPTHTLAPMQASVPKILRPCEGPREMTNDYDIPKFGLAVHLCAGWVSMPTCKIKFVTPEGNELHDAPEKRNNYGMQPDGNYFVTVDEPDCKEEPKVRFLTRR
jgi:hypothetical protein